MENVYLSFWSKLFNETLDAFLEGIEGPVNTAFSKDNVFLVKNMIIRPTIIGSSSVPFSSSFDDKYLNWFAVHNWKQRKPRQIDKRWKQLCLGSKAARKSTSIFGNLIVNPFEDQLLFKITALFLHYEFFWNFDTGIVFTGFVSGKSQRKLWYRGSLILQTVYSK